MWLQTLLIFCCAENFGIALYQLGLPLLRTAAVSCGIFTAMLGLAIWTKFGEEPVVKKLSWFWQGEPPKDAGERSPC